ncbi:VOC family protein [Fulvivirgaceae bacterium BMA10]|uniref:VOC family protein n=1 Tax=Splendidivirga corallicola TaxID=3051826 RepID=A0ABT8KXD3_9BACT|nr:VOC family protein [Fulvivirgaceae bacterium BMA10]
MEAPQFPKGILPVLPVANIDETADYYMNSLQFQENFRQKSPEGQSVNAQLTLEGSTLMINLNPDKAPLEGGGVYLWVRLYEKNIDEYYNSLVEAGVNIADPIKDQFWGDRSFTIQDRNNFFIAFNQMIAK